MNDFEMLDVVMIVKDGVASISVSGELDPFSTPQLKSAFESALRTDACEVTVDLSEVSFIDARGLETLIKAGVETRASGRRFVIKGQSRSVSRLAALLAIDDEQLCLERG